MTRKNKISGATRFSQILSILRKYKVERGVSPQKLRQVIEELGPTYIKLGQIMSMRPDMLDVEYCEELTKLRTDVLPMNIDEVYDVIESSLGKSMKEVFSYFDEKPIGSASIAQAHRATLRKDKRDVVVKVQRKGIYAIMSEDVALLQRAAGFVGYIGKTSDVLDFKQILQELWNAAKEELDFTLEAKNIREFRENNKSYKFITAPEVYDEYTTGSVLVMENIGGYDINEVKQLEANGYDMHEIAYKLADNYMKQVMEDGFFHADPHPGNIKICNGKIAWIDFGMMGRISERDRKLIIAALEGMVHGDVATVKEAVLTLGSPSAPINHTNLYADLDVIISRYSTQDLGNINMEKALMDVMKVAKAHKIAIPSGVTLLGRGLATIEGLMADICPDVNVLELIISYMSRTMLNRIEWKKEAATGAYSLLESMRKTLSLPSLVSSILKSAMKGQIKTNTEISVSPEIRRTADRLITKLSLAFISSALLIGSGIIAATDINPKVWDMPIVSVIGMSLAIILIIFIVIDYFIHRSK
ncbi:MAG: ABC transporter [Clostridiales bacterium]|nr:MAG: ABC transporter [Clostridiales bacterium]